MNTSAWTPIFDACTVDMSVLTPAEYPSSPPHLHNAESNNLVVCHLDRLSIAQIPMQTAFSGSELLCIN